MLVDTHAHLWFDDFADDLEHVLTRAKAAGVEKMIVPGTDFENSRKAMALAKQYPGVVYAAVGVHPEEVLSHNFEETPPSFAVPTRPLAGSPVEESPLGLRELLSEKKSPHNIVAIGEIGMDKTIKPLDQYTIEKQMELFRMQCELALEFDLPVIIHTRESLVEALQVLDGLRQMPRGQFHCFSHDEEGVKQVIERGFYVSFCGNITWSKRVAKLVSLVPDDRLLLETDSPFMMPRIAKSSEHSLTQGSELRGRNEPANVAILAEKIAAIRGQNLAEVAKMTTENAIRLFRL